MSDDLLNQHAAISDLQQAEEIVVDQHKAINEFLAQFLPESRELYNLTNSVEYDQDGKSHQVDIDSNNSNFNPPHLSLFIFFLCSLLQTWWGDIHTISRIGNDLQESHGRFPWKAGQWRNAIA